MIKERHNITIDPHVWKILEELKRTQNKSISELITESVHALIKHHGYNTAYFKMMLSNDFCDDKENEELTKTLDSLTEKDLDISHTRSLDV